MPGEIDSAETLDLIEQLEKLLDDPYVDFKYIPYINNTPSQLVVFNRRTGKELIVFHNTNSSSQPFYMIEDSHYTMIESGSKTESLLKEAVADMPFNESVNELIIWMLENRPDFTCIGSRNEFRQQVKERFINIS